MSSTNYPLEIQTKLKNLYNKEEYLKEHQFNPVTYYTQIMRNSRGMLVFHGTGSGKTMVAEAIADFYRRGEPERQIIVLLPKSLKGNFVKTIKMYMENNPHAREEEKTPEYIAQITDSFKFISLGASNLYHQVEKLSDNEMMEKLLGDLITENVFENKLLIIDEVHNLSNSIVNGSKNGLAIYEKIMETENIRLVFMSATPMINSPFELVPIFNMIRGPIKYKNEKYTLFPENEADFEAFFIDRSKNTARNKDKFMNRVFGLVSYYGTDFAKERLEGFPERKPTKIISVPMSEYQYAQYESMRDLERKEEQRKFSSLKGSDGFGQKSGSSSTYRMRSRQVSNFAMPSHALEFEGRKIKKIYDKVTKIDLQDLEKYSPKFKAFLANIGTEGPEIIYSQFKPYILERLLKINGYTNFTDIKKTGGWDIDNNFVEDYFFGGGKTYAIISGEVSSFDRDRIVQEWNKKENMFGDKIKLLFVTETGAEGLDLKYGRAVHIMEPYWNDSRLEQVIARIVRYKSHDDLPPEKRSVQPYIYISTFPADLKKKIEERTTDEEVLASAIRNRDLIGVFRKLLIEASVDCAFNNKSDLVDCMACTPSNKALYHPNIRQDMTLPNPCKKPVEKKIKAEEIIAETGEKFYYTLDKDQVKIYKFNDKLAAYVPLEKGNPIYSFLVKKILQIGGGAEIGEEEREFEETDMYILRSSEKIDEKRGELLACIDFMIGRAEVAIFGEVRQEVLENLFPSAKIYFSPQKSIKCENIIILSGGEVEKLIKSCNPRRALIFLPASAKTDMELYEGKLLGGIWGSRAKLLAESPFVPRKYSRAELAPKKNTPKVKYIGYEDYNSAAELYIIQKYLRQNGQLPVEAEKFAIKGVLSELQ